MKKLAYRLACLGISAALVSSASFAHHAFTAQYDVTKPAELTGVVVKIDWLNPHTYFYIDIDKEGGAGVTTWAVELGSPVSLMRRGWTRNSMQIGDLVTVEGALARDGSAAVNAQSVVLDATGQRLFSRSASEEREAAEPPR